MTRRLGGGCVLAAMLLVTGRPVRVEAGKAEDTIHVPAGVAQLFVDDGLIGSQRGLVRTLRQPRKDQGGTTPVLTVPSEITLAAKGTILFDPRQKRYVMFAKGLTTREFYRFRSADGLVWMADLDDAGAPHPIRMDVTHPVSKKREGYAGMSSFHYDERDKRYPYKGWVFFGNWGHEHEGIYYVRSIDGLTWERLHMVADGYAGPDDPVYRKISQDGKVVYGPGDTSRFYYDRQRDRFLASIKFFAVDRVGPDNGLRSRAYAFFDKLEAPFDVNWIEHVELLPPAADVGNDTAFDEYYASSTWRYESLWLGGLQVWHRNGDYPHSAAGCAFFKLVVSRDGLHWKKVPFKNDDGVPEVFIPNGAEGGNDGRNDGGYMSEFSRGPIRIGDELVYYYGCSSFGKNHPRPTRVSGGGIFRARLRLDGFVSVDAGTLTTRPLTFDGRDLLVNAVGPVRVEVLDAGNDVLGTATIRGNSLRHRLTFDGRSFGTVATTQPVRLRFTVEDGGALYAFRIE